MVSLAEACEQLPMNLVSCWAEYHRGDECRDRPLKSESPRVLPTEEIRSLQGSRMEHSIGNVPGASYYVLLDKEVKNEDLAGQWDA
jgi:hypothetical protein